MGIALLAAVLLTSLHLLRAQILDTNPPVVDMTKNTCSILSTNPARALVVIPVPVGNRTVMAIQCAALGPNVTLQNGVLDAKPAAVIPPMPKLVSDRFLLDPATPETQTTATFTLAKTPAPGTSLLVSYLSSAMLGDKTIFVPAAATNPKQVVITLPAHRPFTAADVVQVAYQTLE